MTQRISGGVFKQMIVFGAACITQQKQAINDLNVFPVPDGDTGTNMSLTIQTAVTELSRTQPESIAEASKTTASALLRGARGNSGVILSLLFRGVSKSFKGLRDADGLQLAAALQEGAFASEAVEMSVRTAAALPSSFDLRATGTLSPVRDQGVYSTCWAFAALASLESNRIVQGNASSSIDLSEASLAMLTYQHRALCEGDSSALDRYAASAKDEGLGGAGAADGRNVGPCGEHARALAGRGRRGGVPLPAAQRAGRL